MISDWSSDLVNPIHEGQDRYYDEFENFSVRVSSSGKSRIEDLYDEESVLRFVNEVGPPIAPSRSRCRCLLAS